MKTLGARLPTSTFGLVCLCVFALPFAAIGTAMAYVTLRTLLMVMVMQGWPTVPATLQNVELAASGSTERVVASYTYAFNGQQYAGKRVSLYGPDDLGSFHRDAYRELHDYLSRQAPYPLHVNPRAPTESILMPVLRWEALGFHLVFVVLFGGAGWGLIVAAGLRLRKARKEAVLIQRYPNEPWKQRVEWSSSRIESSQRGAAMGEILLAVLWNVTTFPVLVIIPREVASGRYVALTFLVVPLAGVGFVYWAFVQLARAKRFGKTYLQLDTMPGRPGEQLRGHIYAPEALEEAANASLNLRCERQYQVSSTNRGTRTVTEVLWTSDSATPVIRGQTPTGDVMLAVALEIPAGLPDSSRGPGDQYLWLLSASAPLKGADFAAEFEVPMFQVPRGARAAPEAHGR
jgi:hypothetical protein